MTVAPDLMDSVTDIAHLMVVIATCWHS
jgi:hypothetical protein